MKIQRLEEYSYYDSMANDFINSFDTIITESDNTDNYQDVWKKVSNDLKLNGRMIMHFGAGIQAFFPLVSKLMENLKISSLEVTTETVVLLTICAFTIIYIEEKKFKSGSEEDVLTKDSKSMLEELKMRGVGNGIVKKIMKVFKSIQQIFSLIGKHASAVIGGFIDMFAYTALLIPIMNGILYIIGKYNLNTDSFLDNFAGLAIGIGTIITKHGIVAILDKLKLKLNIKKQVLDEIDTSIIKKVSNYMIDPDEMINEQ